MSEWDDSRIARSLFRTHVSQDVSKPKSLKCLLPRNFELKIIIHYILPVGPEELGSCAVIGGVEQRVSRVMSKWPQFPLVSVE